MAYNKLVDNYISCFFQMEDAMKFNNWILNNKISKIMVKNFKYLSNSYPDALGVLLTYLDHENHRLRCRVARDLLPYYEEPATKALKWLMENSDEANVSAKYVLQSWNEQKWK